jgi:hypothetical protein
MLVQSSKLTRNLSLPFIFADYLKKARGKIGKMGMVQKGGQAPLPERPGTDQRLVGCFAQRCLTPF